MANLSGFDANQIEPNGFPPPIPAGDYDAVIVNSELRPNSKGTGQYLKLEVQILNGQYQNRKLFDQLNIDNPNEKAVTIAKATLSAICRAVGVLTPNDSAELHNKPLRIKVVVEKNPQYGDQNKIKAYSKREPMMGGGNGNGTVPTQPTQPMQPTAAKSPWAR